MMKTRTIRAGMGISTRTDPPLAARDAARKAIQPLGAAPDLAFLFFSPHHHDHIREVVAATLREVLPGALLGCSTQAVVGDGREVEDGPGLAVWAATLPGAEIEMFDLSVQDTADGPALVGFPLPGHETSATIVVADPFTFPAQHFLDGINQDHPGVPVIGGMSSGDMVPGGNLLVAGDSVRNFGAVGAVLSGVEVRGLVSQGCRPIGDPYAITASDENVILELGGQPPMSILRETVRRLPEEDHALVQGGLLLGLMIDDHVDDPAAGDFLIRNFRGSLETGAIEVAEGVRPGQLVQFQMRDGAAADAELRTMLQRVGTPPAGALLFTCNGRGVGMFGTPDHDARAVEDAFGPIPSAGMFCQGEIGPVGAANFLHGFTASLALFG